MKNAIRKIDQAIKSLYHLESCYNAADFLLRKPAISAQMVREVQGSMYLVSEGETLSIGIYFHPKVRTELSEYPRWRDGAWTLDQKNAFATASEEVSHFHYFLYHSNQGRQVSQFELELQGEIDRFLLLFFNESNPEKKFEDLFESVFSNFRWVNGLSEEEKERYQDAHQYAKKFTLSLREKLKTKAGILKTVEFLRKYYRLSSMDKMSYLHK